MLTGGFVFGFSRIDVTADRRLPRSGWGRQLGIMHITFVVIPFIHASTGCTWQDQASDYQHQAELNYHLVAAAG